MARRLIAEARPQMGTTAFHQEVAHLFTHIHPQPPYLDMAARLLTMARQQMGPTAFQKDLTQLYSHFQPQPLNIERLNVNGDDQTTLPGILDSHKRQREEHLSPDTSQTDTNTTPMEDSNDTA
jgi:hypothetical protein